MKHLGVNISVFFSILIFSGCLGVASFPESQKVMASEDMIPASFTSDDAGTRTSLSGTVVRWEEGDAVKVHYSNSGNDYKFSVSSIDGGTATFSGMIRESDAVNAMEGVMYPYTEKSSYWFVYWSHVGISSDTTDAINFC